MSAAVPRLPLMVSTFRAVLTPWWYCCRFCGLGLLYRIYNICALKYARSSFKPAIFVDSGFLVNSSLEILEGGA